MKEISKNKDGIIRALAKGDLKALTTAVQVKKGEVYVVHNYYDLIKYHRSPLCNDPNVKLEIADTDFKRAMIKIIEARKQKLNH